MPTDASLVARPSLTVPDLAADGLSLFLDLDGVLAAIAPHPLAVGPIPARSRMLERLQERLDGRLAVVSGRSIEDIDRICDGVVRCVAGIHGLERRHADGRLERLAPAAGVREAVAAFTAFSQNRPGIVVEDKGLAVGLHFRMAEGAAPEARALAQELSRRLDLVLQPGDMIYELKTPGADKGSALTAFMGEAPFVGGRPVMLGDDLTDEHAFEAALTLGGDGVLVGPMRRTAASWRLPDQIAAIDWLDALAESPLAEGRAR